MECTTYYFFIV